MARFIVTTVNDAYTDYDLEATDSADARRQVNEALSGKGDASQNDSVLHNSSPSGLGDRETIISIEEVEDDNL